MDEQVYAEAEKNQSCEDPGVEGRTKHFHQPLCL